MTALADAAYHVGLSSAIRMVEVDSQDKVALQEARQV